MKQTLIRIYSLIWMLIKKIKNYILEKYDSFYFKMELKEASALPKIWRMRICVVVPHVDDDILGMGGLLTALDSNQNEILIIYTTDGRKSYHPDYNEEMMKKKREEEAEQVRKEFVNVNICFLENKSMEWDIDYAVESLSEKLLEFLPHYIFFPAEYDRNLDHVKNAVCLGKCVDDKLDNSRFFSFSVQTPIKKISHYHLMLEDEMKKKTRCLSFYHSQEVMKKSFEKVILFNKLCIQNDMEKEVYGVELFEEFSRGQLQNLASADIAKLNQKFPTITYGKSIRRVNEKCSIIILGQ